MASAKHANRRDVKPVLVVIAVIFIFCNIFFKGCRQSATSAKLELFDQRAWEDDIKSIYISAEDIKSAIGQDAYFGLVNNGFDTTKSREPFLSVLAISSVLCIIGLIIVGMSSASYNKETRNDGVGCGGLLISVVLFFFLTNSCERWDESRKAQSCVNSAIEFHSMVHDINRLNKTLSHIHVIDRLAKAGNKVKIEARSDVVASIGMTRENLMTAMKTIRIFKENPDFKQSVLAQTTIPSSKQAAELASRAGDFADVLNSALEIDRRTADRMKGLLGDAYTPKKP
jgi:hypothetical protein